MKIKNGRLIVKAELYGDNSSLTTDALIDTGAAFTVLPSRFANFLRLKIDKKQPKAKLITASGVIEATRRILNKIKVDELEILNLPVVIHELPAPAPIKVLLGMNFINKVKLEINGKEKEFYIKDP